MALRDMTSREWVDAMKERSALEAQARMLMDQASRYSAAYERDTYDKCIMEAKMCQLRADMLERQGIDRCYPL